MYMRHYIGLIMTVVIFVFNGLVSAVVCSSGHTDLLVGVSSGGQLKLSEATDEAIWVPVSGNAFLPGWVISEPGFNLPVAEDPNNDFYSMTNGSEVYLQAVAIDAGFQAVHPVTFEILDDPNDSIQLGTGSNMHEHLIWHIDSTVLGTDWSGRVEVEFELVDLGSTNYTTSEPFVMTFTNDPYPLGDLDLSNEVDLGDLIPFAIQWLSNCSGPDWCDRADLNQSGSVDYYDYTILRSHFGETGCGP